MASRIITFDRGLKKRAHPHATATFTTAPRRRKRTSLNRRRFTTTFYDTSRRRQPHSRQPVVRVPLRSKLQSGQTGVSCINQVRAPELDHGRVWLLALPAPFGIFSGDVVVIAPVAVCSRPTQRSATCASLVQPGRCFVFPWPPLLTVWGEYASFS